MRPTFCTVIYSIHVPCKHFLIIDDKYISFFLALNWEVGNTLFDQNLLVSKCNQFSDKNTCLSDVTGYPCELDTFLYKIEHKMSSFQDLGVFRSQITLRQKPKGDTHMLSLFVLSSKCSMSITTWGLSLWVVVYKNP